MKIGLIRERKEPADKRVALSPTLCRLFHEHYPHIPLVVESSPVRSFRDMDYQAMDIPVLDDISDCDILLGIKEVPIDYLIPNKTYLFFSHTIKEQPYNRGLLQAILQKNITLIDYETLVNDHGARLLGFGKWAGIVGTYNAMLTWGEKYDLWHLPPAHATSGFEECLERLANLPRVPLKIVFTGNGRVAHGIREILERMKITEVSPGEFVYKESEEMIFTHLPNEILYERKDGGEWSDAHFYANHQDYTCNFEPYIAAADILINGMYWEDDLPPLFKKEDTAREDFRISVIADISCDVNGSVPITVKATDIYHPTYGWSRSQQKDVPKYGKDSIEIMAVTNLPTEMPQHASQEFGSMLLEHILPLLVDQPDHPVLKRATIAKGGQLTEEYSYLQDFVDGK